MPYFQLTDCKIKFQLCVGYFPDGRMRTRTFGIGGVRPDAGADDVAAVARAIAPLLAHPVVCVRLVRKYALVPGTVAGAEKGARGAIANASRMCYVYSKHRRMRMAQAVRIPRLRGNYHKKMLFFGGHAAATAPAGRRKRELLQKTVTIRRTRREAG